MQLVHQLALAAACWLVSFPIHGDTLPTDRTNSPSEKFGAAPSAASANHVHTGPGRQKIYAKLDAISPPQRDITLHQMLDILVLVADRPIKYSVTDFGVLITRGGEDTAPLSTRWFKIDPNTFFNGLQGVMSQRFGSTYANSAVQTTAFTLVPAVRKPGPGSRTPYPQMPGTIVGIDPAETQASPEARFARIKSDFFLLGVDLTQPPKSVVYKDQLGMLMIRGTLADLENVRQLINRCQSGPEIEGTISTPVNSATPRIPQSQK
jgi:hypothetical protein